MKQRVFKFIMVFILFGFVVSLTYTFAWYTYTSKIGKIDADTKDIAFTYTFNDSTEINVNSYSITNLTFFDIDDSYELKYFNDMHTVIKLDIENYSSDIIDYTIDFSTEISEIKDKDGENISRAYVIGFITTSDTISITDDGSNSISNYIQGNKNESGTIFSSRYNNDATNPLEISNGSNENSSVTLYLHLLGVQEIDTANNDFLFDKIEKNGAVSYKAVSYSFTLTIKAVGRTKDPTINTTPSGTSTPTASGTTPSGTSTPTTSGTTPTTTLTTTSTVAE